MIVSLARTAALEQLSKVNAQHYARSRNRLDGAVTRLSAYLRHGVLSLVCSCGGVVSSFGISSLHFHTNKTNIRAKCMITSLRHQRNAPRIAKF